MLDKYRVLLNLNLQAIAYSQHKLCQVHNSPPRGFNEWCIQPSTCQYRILRSADCQLRKFINKSSYHKWYILFSNTVTGTTLNTYRDYITACSAVLMCVVVKSSVSYCKRTYFRTILIFRQGFLFENKSSENSIPRRNVLSRGCLSEN